MAVYLVKTPSGNRLIEARTPSAAVNFAVGKDGYSADSLNTSELASWFKQGLTIETVPVSVKAAA